MKVVARFRCAEKIERDSGVADKQQNPNPVEVRLVPTYDENGPNKSWSKWTPAGEIKMTITNPPAAEAFVPGADYLITFDRAEDAPTA
jgi:hypothetical protein